MANVVLVTGAGASTWLGPDGKGPPMMRGWSDDLCNRLGPADVDLLGLRPNMEGDRFEDRLGSFLRFTRSLPDVAEYPAAGLESPIETREFIEKWFDVSQMAADRVNRHILESLHVLFGAGRIHRVFAEQAYGPLLRSMHADRLTYATTNYDLAGEIALQALGRRPYAGVDQTWSPGEPQPVHLDDLLRDDTDQTPVLHLHGRVGWYLTDNGELVAAEPDAQFNPDLGTPALLLPDPNKVYDDHVTEMIWGHFRSALRDGVNHVLVLGHSLHDDQLVEALREIPDPVLGIAIYATEDQGRQQWEPHQQAVIERLGRSPHIIPMNFGPNPTADHARWRQFLTGNGPNYSEAGSFLTIDAT